MIIQRRQRFYRACSLLTLFFCLPMFLGVAPIFESYVWAQQADAENGAYELTGSAALNRLAESLSYRALDIFEWVRREVRYEAYPGGVKGAIGTYAARSGNALDKALLMGELLNEAHAKWRFAVGTARIAPPVVYGWLGVSTAAQAGAVLDAAGSDYQWVGDRNDPQALILRKHVWIEVNGPYLPLRGGSADDVTTGTAKPDPAPLRETMWVSLDPTITQRPVPAAANIQERLGTDSEAFWTALAADMHPADSEKGVTDIPSAKIRAGVVAAARNLRDQLRRENKTIEEWLAAPASPSLAQRQLLPGNLPYEVAGGVTTYYSEKPDELIGYLRGERRMISLRIGTESGDYTTPWVSVGLPRLAQGTLAIQFAPLTTADADRLTTYSMNNVQVTKNLARLKTRLTLGGVDLLQDQFAGVGLGAPMWAEVREGNGAAARLPILAGGFYVLNASGGINPETAAAWREKLFGLFTLAQQGEGNALQGTTHEAVLSAWLETAGQTMLAQSERFERLGLAALDHQAFGQRRLLAGIEPSITGQYLTTPTLVAHLIDPAPRVVARVGQPGIAGAGAGPLGGMIADAALTAAVERLAGSDAYQSATRLMAINNDAGLVSRALQRDTTNPQGALAGRIPSGAALLAELSDRLRASDLALADPPLQGAAEVGSDHAPAGWAYIESTESSARGHVLLPDGRRASVSAPLAMLFPLDTVQNALKSHYATLLAQGCAWSQSAVKATDALAAAPVAAAALASAWIDPARHGQSPAATPAVSIALHGALDALGVPAIESVEASPAIFNSVAVGSNPAKTQLTVSASVSSVTDEAHFAFTDASGATDFTVEPVLAPAEPSANDDRLTFTQTIDLTTTATAVLIEGTHTVAAWAALSSGVESERKSTEYIVDNHAPRIELLPSTTTATGRFSLSGLADDPHLASYRLLWKLHSESGWVDPPLAQGTQPIPLRTMLGNFDSQQRGWNGVVDFGLEAADRAGNAATSVTQVTFVNDYLPPAATLERTGGGPLADGETLTGAVPLTLAANDSVSPSASFGLTSLRMRIEREGDATTVSRTLVDKAYAKPYPSSDSVAHTLDTFALPRQHAGDRFTIAIDARDAAGNQTSKRIRHLRIGNEPYRFEVTPSFRPGAAGLAGAAAILGSFTQQDAAWILTMLDDAGTTVKSWNGAGNFTQTWDGVSGSGGGFVSPGIYRARLVVTATNAVAERTIAALPPPSSTGFDSWITHLDVRDPKADATTSTVINHGPGASGLAGAKILLTGKASELIVRAHLGAPDTGLPIRPFLDGKGPNPPNWNPPYEDAYWAVEFKSSLAFPTADDIAGSTRDTSYANLTDRSNWVPIAWGNGWGSGATPDGNVVASLDTSPLPEGYYDVRLWATNGQDFAHHVVQYIKVVKSQEGAASGSASAVGAMTLSATDMTVPFTGYNAAITRSYNSNDIYAPGPLGFGWKLGGIALGIEPYPQTGEYDEAMIRLPDGRQFFFANNPYQLGWQTGSQNNGWARYGRYTTRPYGMQLYRPGGSYEYHWPYADSSLAVLQQDDTGLAYGPGANDRIRVQYVDAAGRQYAPGAVAYLQTEDKAWTIFVWKTGDLLEIVKPDGQRTTFEHPNEATIRISDAAERTVIVERETGGNANGNANGNNNPNGNSGIQRITALTDPLGNKVRYEYDDFGNLSTVVDRSGRKRFYIYDTPETKQNPAFAARRELTGASPHFLVDVRVDDDSNGAPRFEGDTLPDDAAARLSGADPQSQEWPGDVSILKVSYENGLLKGIETAAGGVQMQHATNATGGGTETVQDATTGAASKVIYDDQQRVTQVKDAWGNLSTNVYGTNNNISGVLTRQIDPLGHATDYAYTAPENRYNSFSQMFSAYLDSQMRSDANQQGYLTGAQAQPSAISQSCDGTSITTYIAYQIDDPSRADAFQPTRVEDPLHNVTALNYDPTLGSLASVQFTARVDDNTTTDGARVENLYYTAGESPDFKGRLKETTSKATPSATPRATRYAYERIVTNGEYKGERQTVTDLTTGRSTVSEIDAAGRLTKSTDARGRVSVSNYDGEGRLIYSIDPDGNETWHHYDVFGREVSSRSHPAALAGEPNVNFIVRMEYDAAGRVVRTTRSAYLDREDFSGPGRLLADSRTEYTSDESGRSTIGIDRSGRKSVSINDAGGRLARSEQYDAQGRLVDWTAYEYDKGGRTVATTTRLGVTSSSHYDDLGRVDASTVAGGGESRTTTYTYDNGGRQLTSTAPGGLVTTNHYDALGRVASVDVNGTTVQSVAYDNEGRRVTETDAENKSTHWGYDSQGRQTDWWFDWNESSHDGLHFRFKFDADGQQTAFADGNGTTRTKVYDAKGRLAREYSPALTATNGALAVGERMVKEYQYDGRSRVKAIVEGAVDAPNENQATLTATIAKSRRADFTFDPVTGAQTLAQFSDGRTVKYEYNDDDQSLKSSEVWKAGVLIWWRRIAYDQQKRTASVATPEGTVTYRYNENGELAELKTSWGQTTQYQYDCFGRMTAVTSNKLGTNGGTVHYAYDPATGRKSDVTRPNGVTSHYTYDALGNNHIIDHYNATTHLLKLTYTRDNRGIITALEESRDDGASVVNWTYSYDGAKRLTSGVRAVEGGSSVTYGFSYDDAGNRLTKSQTGETTVSYTYNEIGQMLSDGTNTYLYDAFGNLEYEKQGSTPLRRYYWDGENRLIKVDLHDSNNGNLLRTVAMAYNDQGGRVGRKQTAGATVESDVRYLTDYANPTGYSQVIEQLDSSATSVEKDFIYGADLLAQANAGGGLGYLLGDHLGSTRLLTDASGGAINDTGYDYAPYGEPLASHSSLTTYPHAFTGQWRDETLGMQFHRARWLNPSAAIWLSEDATFDWPSNFANLHSYAGLNPLGFADPSGNESLAELTLSEAIGSILVTSGLGAVFGGLDAVFDSDPNTTFATGFWSGLLAALTIATIAFLFPPLMAFIGPILIILGLASVGSALYEGNLPLAGLRVFAFFAFIKAAQKLPFPRTMKDGLLGRFFRNPTKYAPDAAPLPSSQESNAGAPPQDPRITLGDGAQDIVSDPQLYQGVLKNGNYYWEKVDTDAGPLYIVALVRIVNKTLIFDDFMIIVNDRPWGEANQLGVGKLLRAIRPLMAKAKAEGFTELVVKQNRLGGANPGPNQESRFKL